MAAGDKIYLAPKADLDEAVSSLNTHKADSNHHVLVQIGGDAPTAGPALWFNTAAVPASAQQTMLLDLDTDGDDIVQATVDETTYGVGNATVDTPVTQSGIYNFDII